MKPSVVAKHALHEDKVPVHKIQSCFTIYVVVSLNLSVMYGRKCSSLLHFLVIKQTCPLAVQVKPMVSWNCLQSNTNIVQFFFD